MSDTIGEGKFEQICSRFELSLPSIKKAREDSARTLQDLCNLTRVSEATGVGPYLLHPPDGAIVAFGSLARREWTVGSDVDCTLLIDGQADPAHRSASREFVLRLERARYRHPGTTGVFGGLAFSHELIHCIGGEHDTNTNLTRRLLLLLESAPLGGDLVHGRVISGVLKRYLENERTFFSETGIAYKMPRFLLNDIVRYWRTLAVDYACKHWERGDEGWALRNIKLRFSRKLLFVSGLLHCFSCNLGLASQSGPDLFGQLSSERDDAIYRLHRHLVGRLANTPLESLCDHLIQFSNAPTSKKILSAYDAFLHAINDKPRRDELSSLSVEQASNNRLFNELREHSHCFNDGLEAMFFLTRMIASRN